MEGISNESPEAKNGSFEDQFAKKERIKVTGGVAEVIDIKAENPELNMPVFFAPAWGCTTEVYKPALKTLSETNRRTLSLDHPRTGGDMSKTPEEFVKKYPKEELRKAMNILDIMDEKGIPHADIIAHSEGAINIAIAATLHPEKFKNIVFFAPAGLIGKNTFGRLLKGFAGQGARAPSLKAGETTPEIPVTDTEKQVAGKAITEAIKYFAKNPLRGFREGKEIADSDIYEMLKYLHKEKGIGITIMSGVDDPVFPMEKMQKMVKSEIIDGFLSLRGGHGEIGNHPELYMKAAEDMLRKMDQKKTQTNK